MNILSQVSVEHDNNFRVNCVKSQDCRRTLAGEARTKAGNDPTLIVCVRVGGGGIMKKNKRQPSQIIGTSLKLA